MTYKERRVSSSESEHRADEGDGNRRYDFRVYDGNLRERVERAFGFSARIESSYRADRAENRRADGREKSKHHRV